jgi:hypothetical protein
MITRERVLNREGLPPWTQPALLKAPARLSGLHLVTTQEIAELEGRLSRGQLPLDFEEKLERLRAGNLAEGAVEQNCRLLISLLIARLEGLFSGGSRADADRLLRVLAYVRKDEDRIPDYRPNGFKDDLEELREAMVDLEPLVDEFKNWRLRHQVPAIWLHAEAKVRREQAAVRHA